MFTRIKGGWGALGVMLALVALYLVLTRSQDAQRLISASTSGGNTIFRTLQGR